MTSNVEANASEVTQTAFETEVSQLTDELKRMAEWSAYPSKQRHLILSELKELSRLSQQCERENTHRDTFSDPELQDKIRELEQNGARSENIRDEYTLPLWDIPTNVRLTLDEFVNAKVIGEAMIEGNLSYEELEQR